MKNIRNESEGMREKPGKKGGLRTAVDALMLNGAPAPAGTNPVLAALSMFTFNDRIVRLASLSLWFRAKSLFDFVTCLSLYLSLSVGYSPSLPQMIGGLAGLVLSLLGLSLTIALVNTPAFIGWTIGGWIAIPLTTLVPIVRWFQAFSLTKFSVISGLLSVAMLVMCAIYALSLSLSLSLPLFLFVPVQTNTTPTHCHFLSWVPSHSH
jgi:hypothetical protein